MAGRKGTHQIRPKVRQAFTRALSWMRQDDDPDNVAPLARLFKGWMEDEDPRIRLEAIKLAGQYECQETKVHIQHEHTGADISGIDEWLVRIAERRGEAARESAGEEEPAVSPDRHLRAH